MRSGLRKALLLYLVTDNRYVPGGCLMPALEKAVSGGVTMVQLRDKTLNTDGLAALASVINELTKPAGIPLIINEDLEAALISGAEGVHFGPDDMAVSLARRAAGNDLIIGASANSVEEALHAESDGADYIGAGALYASATKTNTRPLSPETFRAICRAVRIPVVGIGGITFGRIASVMRMGAAGIAVSSMVLDTADIRKTAEKARAQLGCLLEEDLPR